MAETGAGVKGAPFGHAPPGEFQSPARPPRLPLLISFFAKGYIAVRPIPEKVGTMGEGNKDLIPLIKNVTEAIDAESLAMEAARDLIKDEIKRVIRAKLEDNPKLRDEIKEAISLYLEAKARQTFALVKLTKCGAKLGLELIPPGLKADISKELLSIFEKELVSMMDKGL